MYLSIYSCIYQSTLTPLHVYASLFLPRAGTIKAVEFVSFANSGSYGNAAAAMANGPVAIAFEFNSGLKAWHYGCELSCKGGRRGEERRGERNCTAL